MKLVKENLVENINENYMNDSDGGRSLADVHSEATNQLKNIAKNVQSILDIIQTGAQMDPWIQSNIAVVDSKIQDSKNSIENSATDIPAGDENMKYDESPTEDDGEILEPIAIGDTELESPEAGDMEYPEMEDSEDMLPPPFPDDEIEDDGEFNIDIDGDGIGDVNVLDVETRYEGDENDD